MAWNWKGLFAPVPLLIVAVGLPALDALVGNPLGNADVAISGFAAAGAFATWILRRMRH